MAGATWVIKRLADGGRLGSLSPETSGLVIVQ